MTATLVEKVRTLATVPEMIEGFIKGWYKQFGILPKKEAIGVLFSQWSLETGQGKACWNWNLGNVKYQPNSNPDLDNDKKYVMLVNVWEIDSHGNKIVYQPPSQATWFRAFDTLADGVAFHLDFLKNHRYKASWSAIENGEPTQFAHLLRVAGYYTAPEADYVRAMNIYFNKYMADPTFDNVITSMQPKVEVDPNTNQVTVTGDLTVAPKPKTNVLDTFSNLFSSLFGKNS